MKDFKELLQNYKPNETENYIRQLDLEDKSLDKQVKKVDGDFERLIKEQPTSIKTNEDIIADQIKPLADQIKIGLKNIKKRLSKQGGHIVCGYEEVKNIKPLDLSASILEACLTAATTNMSRTETFCIIGHYAEILEFTRRAIEFDKKAYKKAEKSVKKVTGQLAYREKLLRDHLHVKGMPRIAAWDDIKKERVGSFLFDFLRYMPGSIFEEERIAQRDIAKIVFTAKVQSKLDAGKAILKTTGVSAPPLISGACVWKDNDADCFNSKVINNNTKMVSLRTKEQKRALSKAIIDASLQPHIDANNIINNVPLSIDTEINNFINDAWEFGLSFNPSYPKEDIPLTSKEDYALQHNLPVLSFDSWSEDHKKALKDKRRHQRKRNQAIKSVRNQRNLDKTNLNTIIENGNKFKNITKDCWRGRLGQHQTINIQREDSIRGQIVFYNKYKLTDEGELAMLVEIASLYGADKMDKARPDIAAQWTLDNLDKINDVYKNTEDNLQYVLKADKPVQYLRTLNEYYNFRNNPDYETGSISFLDQSSSGLMIIAAAMKCENLGYFTNVVTTHSQEYSNDIYGHMGERVTDLVTDEEDNDKIKYQEAVLKFCTEKYGEPIIPRSLLKRPVMTWPYSGTPSGFGDQIYDDTFKKEIDRFVQKERTDHPFETKAVSYDFDLFAKHCATYLGILTHRDFETAFPRAKAFMQFIRQIAKVCAAENKQFRFTSPITGFPFIQCYVRRSKGGRIRLPLRDNVNNIKHGHTTATLALYSDENEIHLKDAMNGSCPNLVHSIDGSFMRAVINKAYKHGIKDIQPIHDCWGVHPNNVNKMRAIICEEFANTFTDYNFLQLVHDQNSAMLKDPSKMPDIPEKGRLDVTKILTSQFAFR